MPPTTSLFSAFLCRRILNNSQLIHHHFRRRRLHSSVEYPLTHPIYTIWASNTSLGKTLVSAGLSMSFLSSSAPLTKKKFLYLKPIQTGFPDDSDSRFVYRKFSEFFAFKPLPFPVYASNSVLKASTTAANQILGNLIMGGSVLNEDFGDEVVGKVGGLQNVQWYEERKLQGGESSNEAELFPVSEVVCKTMYGWKEAVSPHLAAEKEEAMVSDSEVLDMLKRCLGNGGVVGSRDDLEIMCVIETAGGVASPGPSGSLQCDLYRILNNLLAINLFSSEVLVEAVMSMQSGFESPFRLPAILVGDGRLGGISGTISAYESLKLRGYDVAAVIFEDNGLKNEVPLLSYFRNRVPVLVLPSIPKDTSDDLISWFDKSQMVFTSLQEIMLSAFLERTQRLHEMPNKACDVFWWPFTQHKLVPEEKVTVIDSRCGENFAVHKAYCVPFIIFRDSIGFLNSLMLVQVGGLRDLMLICRRLQIELARDMGYTAARYGHVMFPENVYEPALELAELLLEGVHFLTTYISPSISIGWASRVYFSDNGSTAVEIALKMAFRKFLSDSDLVNADVNGKCMDLKVLALRGSYHGDTLGAMEAQAPSPYTGFLQQPWYRGRGLFLDPPTVSMYDGTWEVSLPEKIQFEKSGHGCLSFSSRDEIFKRSRDSSVLASLYTSSILQELQLLSDSAGLSHIGALIIEPGKNALYSLIQGAGGMEMIDPLYQRILVRECKRRKIPVIFDELGELVTDFIQSAAEMLYCQPDIACFAKLMTGGIIPLAATLASDAVFDAFTGDSKLKALLHGHSYSAHAMGCAAAVKSVKWFKDCKTNTNMILESRLLQELWDAELVEQISLLPAVRRVVALGTLCAIELLAEGSNAGYASTYASSIVKKLREDGLYMRPLGNVIYVMCGPCTFPDTCRRLLEKVYARIQDFDQLENNESAVFAA
ncbi:bifunctional dethiobiotin synthetase/7 8-diamino-pelargonic acid aminotransferase mitochondrial [Phtheirospermum japonicum]|uniref:Bifunctional dethiobiotin synthetase/7 8-diamino-pelargonic acid aminotransferase mitochondrial n=1 Tax=Phtheirospermum japonicum TaxID=374723 RepID=A0A830D0G9_9LAMI|nr:bifunctional dethiobiotin synthetase/7 8-diamino-pelargonic acid aminotransferase mitochondrial [Phtheirospermum japonicum]